MRNMFVHVLSTNHSKIEFHGPKNKPYTFVDYNNTKYGAYIVHHIVVFFKPVNDIF